MPDIRADLSQYYGVKSLFERILGRAAFLRVKDYGPLSAWRANYARLFQALAVAAEATVEVADDEWRREVNKLLATGLGPVKTAESIDELHAAAASTLGELAFLQLGFVPQGHSQATRVPLSAKNWKLDAVRTVQYVQSSKQSNMQVRLSQSVVSEGGT